MMTRWRGIVVAAVVLAAGCRTSVHQVQVDRVDQDLEHGNRGYLVGQPPAVGERGTTRDITELEVQLSSGKQPSRKRQAAAAAAPSPEMGEPAATETTSAEPTAPAMNIVISPHEAPATPPAAASVTNYTVKKGDSLSRIAKKVYGNGRLWPRIYDANRDQLPNPNTLRPGMVLKIPAASSAHAHHGHRHAHRKTAASAPSASTGNDLK